MAKNLRHDFTKAVKMILAARVGHRCSNPDCRTNTSGPRTRPPTVVNVGVAAHITAAAAGGPRFDSGMTPKQRTGQANGIWLCQNCAKLADNDSAISVETLRAWKFAAEGAARAVVGKAPLSPRKDGGRSGVVTFGVDLRRRLSKPDNDRGLVKRLEEILRDHTRRGMPRGGMSLALVDIDAQTAINRRYGRPVGDSVLSTVLRLLESSTGSPFTARWGDDSFYAVLPERRGADAHAMMEMFCESVRSHDWSRLAPGLHVSCSIGIAEFSSSDRGALDWAARAADGVRRAKRDGGNCVEQGPAFLPEDPYYRKLNLS